MITLSDTLKRYLKGAERCYIPGKIHSLMERMWSEIMNHGQGQFFIICTNGGPVDKFPDFTNKNRGH